MSKTAWRPWFRGWVHFGLSALLLIGGLGWSSSPRAAAQVGVATVPAGFIDIGLVDNIGGPTALVFTPDNRMLVANQTGTLRVYNLSGALQATALTLPASVLCFNSERGLLGLAVDPNFDSNNYIYLYYTYNKFHSANPCPTGSGNLPVNRVSRFVLPANNIIVTATETVLLDNIPSINGNHNGGDINFGKDGYLYISVGESGTGGSLARLKTNLAGKILRIGADGAVPTSNPFYNDANAWRCGNPAGGTGTGSCREIYAYGLRNPFRIAFDPNAVGTRFFINDVGQGTWEEIDEGVAGADYGWNVREGPCPSGQNCTPASNLPSAYTDPIHWYGRGVGTVVTGGAFVPNGIGWPTQYDGAYLFADYGAGTIFRINRTSTSGIDQYTRNNFATSLGGSSAVHLRFGPYSSTQALYYTTYASGGEVRRISFANAVPTAVASANPLYSATLPMTVTFSALGSSDPDNNPLTFDWNFGDTLTTTTSSITTTHTYTQTGIFTATLIARDNVGASSAPVSVQIQAGNTPPAVTILAPDVGALFAVGQVITATGVATDTEDGGVLLGARLSWEIRRWHIYGVNAHYHPWHSAAGTASTSFSAPGPEDLDATDLSYVEIRLTATDSWGLSSTITRTLQPNRVTVTFVTSPPGLRLSVNERTITGTTSLTSWENFDLAISGSGQVNGSNWWIFPPATLTTPASPITYTAVFVLAQVAFLPIVRR